MRYVLHSALYIHTTILSHGFPEEQKWEAQDSFKRHFTLASGFFVDRMIYRKMLPAGIAPSQFQFEYNNTRDRADILNDGMIKLSSSKLQNKFVFYLLYFLCIQTLLLMNFTLSMMVKIPTLSLEFVFNKWWLLMDNLSLYTKLTN